MQTSSLRALLVDDSQMQYAMMRDFLAVATQGTITLDWAFTYEAGLTSIRANQHDIYLVDYQLGDHSGLELLAQAVAEGCTTPIILITGHGNRETDLAAMQMGAADYLDKSEIKPSTLERAIRYATERAKIMAALRESEEVHRHLLAVTRQQAHELMLLDKARTVLADQLDLSEVIHTTVELVAETFGYTQVSIYLVEGDTLILQHQVGYDHVIAAIPMSQGVSGRVFRTGQPILLEDVHTDPAFLGAIEGIVSEICIPLFDHEQVIGTLNVESTNGVQLTEDNLRLLTALGTHVSIVIGRARLYAEVRRSEERYRLISELISDFAFSVRVNPDGTMEDEWFTYDAFTRMTGYTRQEVLENGRFSYYHPDDVPAVEKQFTGVLEGRLSAGEFRIVTRSGDTRWLYLYHRPVWDEVQQRVVRIYGTAQDITERKRAENAEREQRILAEALRDTAAALNSTLNFEEVVERILSNVGRVVPHDTASLMLFEGNYAQVIRASFPGIKDTAETAGSRLRIDVSSAMPSLTAAGKIGQPVIIPDILPRLDDTLTSWMHDDNQWGRTRSYAGIPILIEGEMIGFLNLTSATPNFFTADTAARLQAFSHQIAIAIQNARRYEQAQELATLNERQRLARDLHDAVSQTLFSASVISETIPHLWQDMPTNAQEVIAELHHLNRQALAEMRSLLLELRPRALIETSMDELLEQLVEIFTRRHRTNVVLNVDKRLSLPAEVQVGLYRIAQEALNNIGKHAQASAINLELIRQGEAIEMSIWDNGRGFDPDDIPANHFGIRIMYERAQAIGAALDVTSQPGQGTSITIRWPAPPS